MSFISITNTFASATLIESGKVNQNYADIANGLKDGIHDISMAAGVFNDQLLIASGTTAVPGIAFKNSPTTGMYSPATDVNAFVAAGNEVGRFSSSGAWALGVSGTAATHAVYGNLALNNGGVVQSGVLNVSTHEELTEIAAPSSATSGTQKFYAGTDSLLHSKTEEGYDYPLGQTDFNGLVGTPTVTYLGSRQIRIAHPFSYYFQGIKFNSTTDVDVTVPNTTGNYLLYFTDAKGTAIADLSSTYNFFTHVIYAGFYWNSSTSDYMFFNEKHGYLMDDSTHEYLHRTRGASYRDGGAISGYVLNSDTLVDVQVAIDQTRFYDEDVALTLAARTEGTNWDKWYRSTNGDWIKDAADTIPVFHGSNIPKYNSETAAPDWTLVSVTNTDYFNTYIFGTNSAESTNRFIVIPGQSEFTTLSAAQAVGVAALNLGGLPVQEIIPLYQLTWEYRTTYTGNNARVRLRGVLDLRRTVSPSVSAGVSTSHNSLAGRSDTDAHPASAITNTPSGNLAATDIQTAVNELQTDIDNVSLLASSSGKNYVTNPSAKFNTTSWTAIDANITITRDTTTAIPRYTTTGTAIKLVSSTDEKYAYYRFLLDDVDQNKKLGLNLAVSIAVASQYRVEMWKNSASDYTGTYTELSLTSDSSGDSYFPVGDGVYQSTFMTDTTPYLELRIVHNGTDNTAAYISDVTITPDPLGQGFVGTNWESFTPDTTGTWTTNVTWTGRKRIIGDTAELEYGLTLTGAPGGTAQLGVNLPSGMTINASKILALGRADSLGHVYIYQNANTGEGYMLQGYAEYDSGVSTSAKVRFLHIDNDASSKHKLEPLTATFPNTFGNTDYVKISLRIPINEAGPIMNIADISNKAKITKQLDITLTGTNWTTSRCVGYAYSDSNGKYYLCANGTGTLGASPATSIALDITGVKFKNTAGYDQNLSVSTGTSPFVGLGVASPNTSTITLYSSGISVSTANWRFSAVDLELDEKPTWFDANVETNDWQPVGFGYVSSNASGLMPASNASLDNVAATRLGLKPYYHGTTYNGGNAPTITITNLSSVQRGMFVPYQLQDGTWMLYFNMHVTLSSGTSAPDISVAGITSKNISNFYQSIRTNQVNNSAYTINGGYVAPNGNIFTGQFSSAVTLIGMSGDIELESKPNWAY